MGLTGIELDSVLCVAMMALPTEEDFKIIIAYEKRILRFPQKGKKGLEAKRKNFILVLYSLLTQELVFNCAFEIAQKVFSEGVNMYQPVAGFVLSLPLRLCLAQVGSEVSTETELQ